MSAPLDAHPAYDLIRGTIEATDDVTLAASLLMLDAVSVLDETQRLVRALICDECERRHPAVAAAVAAWAADLDVVESYSACVVSAMPVDDALLAGARAGAALLTGS